MAKSPDAFRTISEVADWLDRPAHVLRFWESKFSQVKPVKRAGGRRYYRPQDMLLLGGIKKLLHDDGMTIKGVQKLLREQGVQHVAALSQPLDGIEPVEPAPAPAPVAAEPENPDNLVAFKRPESENKPDVGTAPSPAKAGPATEDQAAEPQQVSLFEFTPEPTVKASEKTAEAVEEQAAPAPESTAEPAAGDQPAAAEAEREAAAGPGVLSALLARKAPLPAAKAAPLLQRVKAHAKTLRKAGEEG